MSNQSTPAVHVVLIGSDDREWSYDVPTPLRELIVSDPFATILEPPVDHWHRFQQFDVAHFMSRAAAPMGGPERYRRRLAVVRYERPVGAAEGRQGSARCSDRTSRPAWPARRPR
jgi:hypothetical protein